jgi:uncharacterized membrane protein YkoI
LCGLALWTVGPAAAAPVRAQTMAVFAGQAISLERAIALVERRFQARVVRAAVTGAASRPVYELKLLSEDGRVWTVRVDARTGEVR